MVTTSSFLTLRRLEGDERVDAVMHAVSRFDLPSSDAWAELDQLSTNTAFDDLDANIDGIFERSDGKVEIVGAAYVTLNYGGKKEHVSMTESFPAKLVGSFDEAKQFIIESAAVDTSDFFG